MHVASVMGKKRIFAMFLDFIMSFPLSLRFLQTLTTNGPVAFQPITKEVLQALRYTETMLHGLSATFGFS